MLDGLAVSSQNEKKKFAIAMGQKEKKTVKEPVK
jgi:hypothetical protein